MDMLEPISRPPGAEEHDAAFTTALHAGKHSRKQRARDFCFNPAFYLLEAEQRNLPLDDVLESNVEAPTTGDMPTMIGECMRHKGIFVKGGYSGISTPMKEIYNDDASRIITDAYFTRKLWDAFCGGLEDKADQRLSGAAARTDSGNKNTALRPHLQKNLTPDKMVGNFSFTLEHVYADVIPTDEDKIDELIFKSEKTQQEMHLRDELGDLKVVDVDTDDDTKTMKELALAVRYSEKFSRNEARMSAIDMWVDFVIIRGRNAIRNEGVRKAATGLTEVDQSSYGYTLKGLRKLELHFNDIYPNTLLIMSEDTFIDFDQPLGRTSSDTDEDTSENFRSRSLVPVANYNILNSLSSTTDIGVVKEDKVIHNSNTDRVLQIAPDFCMDLHVYRDTFQVKTVEDTNNDTFRTSVKVEYVPIFKHRDARALHRMA